MHVPKSGIELYEFLSIIYDQMDQFWYGDALFMNLLILIGCTIVNPGFEQCTENVFADLTLNGGKPAASSVYGLFNLYTWVGWLHLLGWVVANQIFFDLWENFGKGIYTGLVWMFYDIPLCVEGDLYFFGVDCTMLI